MIKILEIPPGDLVVSDELRRSGKAKQFEDRLRSSIEQIGLAEPLKVARMPSGKYLVVDGAMRLRAIMAVRENDPSAFMTVPAYLTDYERRFEIRYQTDIYQDLLPSQLATLVEHLHTSEGVKKIDIARYIGVSPATLRNYTDLARLIQNGGLFAKIVELMDVGVMPASNPFAWKRLTPDGLMCVLRQLAGDDEEPEIWIERMITAARQGQASRYATFEIEAITGGLPDEYYRTESEIRSVKKSLGTRRALGRETVKQRNRAAAVTNLERVFRESKDPVLTATAGSLKVYLQ
ncbi:MAG TPA: ParB N-terminal domain-containing protein [Tepidiformaceae bacterium]|nr:ParB N-terminal domain-containing protein [Tepidiformaceae bacterium]